MNLKQSSHITIDELRQCPEFAHLDDILAQNVINTLENFCAIVANQYKQLTEETNNSLKTIENDQIKIDNTHAA